MNTLGIEIFSKIKGALELDGFQDENSQAEELAKICGVTKRTARGWVRKESFPTRLPDAINKIIKSAVRLQALPEAKKKTVMKTVMKIEAGVKAKDPHITRLLASFNAGEISADEFCSSI